MENIIFRKIISVDCVFYGFDQKIFYTSIFTTNDFRTQTGKERERERARRETRESEIGLASSQTTAPSPDTPMSLCQRDLAARSRRGDRPCEIAPL